MFVETFSFLQVGVQAPSATAKNQDDDRSDSEGSGNTDNDIPDHDLGEGLYLTDYNIITSL